MSAHVRMEGLDTLIRELTSAPEDIREDGMVIIREATESTVREVQGVYNRHSKTGNLAKRVKAIYPSDTILVGIVQSTAPHAHLFEFGTRDRKNDHGANRGKMPAAESLVPIAEKQRARMFARLKQMLASKGFALSD